MKKSLLFALLLSATANTNANDDPHVNAIMEQSYRRDHERQQGAFYAKTNLCSQLKELLVTTFNEVPEYERDYGHLIRVDDIATDNVMVSNNIPIMATCKGNFVFKGGKTTFMYFGFGL